MTDVAAMAFTSDEPPTLAEIYRTLLRIEAQTTATNGRLRTVERDMVRTDERIHAVETAHASCPVMHPDLGDYALDRRTSHGRRETDPIDPERLDVKRLAIGIAMVGSAAWAAVELIMRLGEWLQTMGLRK